MTKYACVALIGFCSWSSSLPAQTVSRNAQAPTSATAAAAALKHLFRESDEASLRRNPVMALARGDLRYADRLGDFLSDAFYEADRQAARADLAALANIDRSTLNPNDRVAYDVFKWQRGMDLRGLEGEVFAATVVRPIDHFNGFQR